MCAFSVRSRVERDSRAFPVAPSCVILSFAPGASATGEKRGRDDDRARDRPAPPRPRRLRSGARAAVRHSAAWWDRSSFFDHMGPIEFAPGIPRSVDVRPHPHIGLSTVTYLFDGEIMHRDSLGSEQAIRPGEVNWMTAGRGITHSERFERARREGGLTARHPGVGRRCREKRRRPSPPSTTTAPTTCPSYESGGLWARLVAGEAFGAQGRGAHAFAAVLRPLEARRGRAARSSRRATRSAPPTS